MSGQHCENYDVKRETVHCYPRNVDRCCTWPEVAWCCHWNLSAFFKICFCFALLYNKSLNDWSLGEQWIFVSLESQCFSRRSQGKHWDSREKNSLFPKGPVILKVLNVTMWCCKLVQRKKVRRRIKHFFKKSVSVSSALFTVATSCKLWIVKLGPQKESFYPIWFK